MNMKLKIAMGVATLALATQAMAQITFYEGEGFRGRTFVASRAIPNMQRFGFNDRASSVIVKGGSWEVCENVNFSGRCVIMLPGNYPSLNSAGLNYRFSSVRAADGYARLDG